MQKIRVTKDPPKRPNWCGLEFAVLSIVPPGHALFPDGAYEIPVHEVTRVLEQSRPEVLERWMQKDLGGILGPIQERVAIPLGVFIPQDCAELFEGTA